MTAERFEPRAMHYTDLIQYIIRKVFALCTYVFWDTAGAFQKIDNHLCPNWNLLRVIDLLRKQGERISRSVRFRRTKEWLMTVVWGRSSDDFIC
jgi:hypothetical protein